MKTEIEKEMTTMYNAMKAGLLSVNDYCTMVHCLSQKLKELN